MKRFLVVLGCLVFTSSLLAQNAPSVQQITNQVKRSTELYSNAISCSPTKVSPKDIAALNPYKEDGMDAKYAVIWSGDVGCAGGSGTHFSNIAIVKAGIGTTFYVDPLLSSPGIAFEIPVRYVDKIVGNTRDTLILEGMGFGENDANCCPSIKLRFTLRVDEKGNWKMIEKKILPSKK